MRLKRKLYPKSGNQFTMLTIYDYIVIGFYFLFVMSLGFVFKRFNKGSKDYFA